MPVADQAPIGSGFQAKSTAREVLAGIDLSGQNIIVTGGYSGIGLETVRALAGAGARVTRVATRHHRKGHCRHGHTPAGGAEPTQRSR